MLLGIIILGTTIAYADTPPLIDVGYEQIDNGYEAAFTISNNPGISSFKFSIFCKDGTIPKEVKKSVTLKGGIFQSNINEPTVVEDGTIITVLWINSENYKSDGNIFSIVFETQALAEPIIYLSYENGDVIDEDFNDVPLAIDEKLVLPKEDEPENPKEDESTTTPDEPQNNNGSIHSGNIQNNPSSTKKDAIEENNNLQLDEKNEVVFKFSDVQKDDWYYEAVKFSFEKGITSGVSETSYAPVEKVTRGQFITMLCRAYGIKEMTGDNFVDCGNTWYTGYLAAAKQLGISNGVGDNKFAPEKEITREEMVTLVYNYLKSAGEVDMEINKTTFVDDDAISAWAKNGVAFASSKGYVTGKGNNIFDPNGHATRAELAQIFFNIFNK